MGKVLYGRAYEIIREGDGELLAKASSEWAYVDFRKQTPRRIPKEVSAAFSIREELQA